MSNQITKIIIRNGTDSQRRTANITGVTFNLGEPAFCTDTQRLYIGNGTVGGTPASTRNLGRVETLFGTYLNSGFSKQAYDAFVTQGAESGDIIFDASTRTIYSLSARSNLTTSDVPLVADLVKYDASTLVNSVQFYYDSGLYLNLQTQAVDVTKLNSNVIDGITLSKATPSLPISIAQGSVSNGIGVEHLRYIDQNSLYLNSTNNTNQPVLQYVGPGEVIGRTASSSLTAISINQILYTATYTAGPGFIITPTTSSIIFEFDPAYIACGNQFYINTNTTVTGNLSCTNSTATGNAAVSGNLTVGGVLNVTGSTKLSGNLDVVGSITSPTFGALKNMASFTSPRINTGTIPLFRTTYDIQIITPVTVNATGGTPTFSPAITLNSTVPAGTLVSLIAGTSLTNVDISFGYKYL